MDEVDLTIVNILWENSRIPLREIADRLELSVNSVHKRINNLVDSGIIERFFTMPKNLFPNSVGILLFGKSNSPALEKSIKRLGKTGNTGKIVTGLDNWIMVSSHLRSMSNIGPFTEEVVRELAMDDYTFGLFEDCPEEEDFEPASFSKLDYKILQSLSVNSRKPISDVAEELGVSPKTVKRRLTKMEKEGSIYSGIDWQPTISNDIISYMYLTLKTGVGRKGVIADLANNYKPHWMNYYSFSNLPDFLLVTFWGKTMREINDIQQRLKETGNFKKIVTNIQYKAYHFETWLGEHMKKMAND